MLGFFSKCIQLRDVTEGVRTLTPNAMHVFFSEIRTNASQMDHSGTRATSLIQKRVTISGRSQQGRRKVSYIRGGGGGGGVNYEYIISGRGKER